MRPGGTPRSTLARVRRSRMCGAGLLAALWLAAAGAAASAPSAPASAVDVATPGDDLPPQGRSLFDHLMIVERNGTRAYDPPTHFAALRQRIEAQVQRDTGAAIPGLKQVLIPLGRSLQRTAAGADFFASPRIVLAVDEGPAAAAGQAGMLLKDRLFLGYQARSDVVEVISWNEAAGRFEFQVVKDLRPGAAPKVVYANRALCMSCHQNGGPIFARPTWDETNANPRVAARLAARAREFHGVPVDRGVDVPNAIDDATDRANLLDATQQIWREGCAVPECRAALFVAALQFRLSGLRQFDRRSTADGGDPLGTLADRVRARWPDGLAIPNPDIPNRDPLPGNTGEGEPGRLADVAAPFDPLALRPALARWRFDDPTLVERSVAGLADFIAEADIARLDQHLTGQARRAPRRSLASPCTVAQRRVSPAAEQIEFACAPGPAGDALHVDDRIELAGGMAVSGRLRRLQFGGQGELREIERGAAPVAAVGRERRLSLRLRSDARQARGADGRTIEHIELRWVGAQGSARIVVVDDFAPVMAAVEAMLAAGRQGRFDGFDAQPLRRARLMPALFEHLRMPALRWCCIDTAGMPPPQRDPVATEPAASARAESLPPIAAGFYPYCASCHAGADRSPPNFLSGDAAQVRRQLTHCAERLYVRLAMGQIAPALRPKTPMPPATALRALHLSDTAWRDGPALAGLVGYARDALRSGSGSAPEIGSLLASGYENLRPCLPPADTRGG